MTTSHSIRPGTSALSRSARVWIAIGLASWSVALILTTNPPLTNGSTFAWTGLALVVLVAMIVALADPLRPQPQIVARAALAVSLGGWAVLMFHDDQWSILTFVLYALFFAQGRTLGLMLAGAMSAVWLVAWIDADEPGWRLLIPFAAFGVGSIMAITMHWMGDENESQAALIEQLRATRGELAASERQRGILEERARFAGEIHDTLAQGFTSIVLLSRATRRGEDWHTGLASIEMAAEDNLEAARRLVAAMQPVELEQGSLTDALERQLETLGNAIDATLTVSGTPVSIDRSVEVAILRAAQEALLNVRTHAHASTVHVTLSYVGSTVALDVLDNGVGFTNGRVAERGSLTGGQGLAALRRRAETLGGHLDIEPAATGGTVVSLQLPTGSR